MIRELGEVVQVKGQWATIQTHLQSGCGGCQQQNVCGAGVLAKALPNRRGLLEVWLEQPPAVGSQVELLLPEKAMMQFSVLLYFIPLVSLFAGAWFGHWLVPSHEGASIALALLAFAASFWQLRRWLRGRDARVQKLLQVNLLESNSAAGSEK